MPGQQAQRFDVFMCHNSEDKTAVIELAERLESEGLRPWLDEWELQPGLSWKKELLKQIGEIATVAVFIGRNGLGPWQEQEIDAFLDEFVERGCPVIPVLLKSAPERPAELPLFLKGKTWVDFRRERPEPFVRLVWGITGENPRRKGQMDAAAEFSEIAEPLITSKTIERGDGFEERYLLCQATDVQSLQSVGPVQHTGIFVPLLRDVFVPLTLDFDGVSPGFRNLGLEGLQRGLDIWKFLARVRTEATFRQIAILAWGGYGKTTLLKHVAYRYGTGRQREGVPILVPFLLALRKHRQLLAQAEPPSLPELIERHHVKTLSGGEALQVPEGWAMEVLRSGRGIVMFDGFDEVAAEQRPAVSRWLTEQMRQYPESVFIMTSRPKAYREQDAAARLVLRSSLWVKEFDARQRRDFITSWYDCQERYANAGRETPDVKQRAKEATEDLLAQIEENVALKDLAKNPLLLTMIATFHRRYQGASLPRRKVELYREICQLQLKDRPRARRLKTLLVECDAQAVLQRVAFEMMMRKLERVAEAELLEVMAAALLEQEESVNVSTFLETVVDVSELIVLRDDAYEFAHLSFQEYLAASYIAGFGKESVLYEGLSESWWKPTILLYAGIVNPTKLIEFALEHGAINLANECVQESRKRINEVLQTKVRTTLEHSELNELEKIAQQVTDARYTDLERYLQNGQWQEADDETYRLMITEVGKEEGQFLNREDLSNFHCRPLQRIDSLWTEHSNGRFGFSVQKELFQECGGIVARKSGWNAYSKFLSVKAYSKFSSLNGWSDALGLGFEALPPRGYFPTIVLSNGIGLTWSIVGTKFYSLIFRLITCAL